MALASTVETSLAAFDGRAHELSIFMTGIGNWFVTHPRLSTITPPIVHSVKMRLKDREHLREKISRKSTTDDPIGPDNLFAKVTDLAGVRVLHLYQEQARLIHEEIMKKVNEGDWYLPEAPKAYTWDPESQKFFEQMGINVQVKESFYTSLHYLVRPRPDSPLCCEIQVRTLFEEIWGEVDHSLNYPTPTENIPCREQLRVLAKVVGAGSRLVDSIFRSAAPADSEMGR